jgi:hypothetical protein
MEATTSVMLTGPSTPPNSSTTNATARRVRRKCSSSFHDCHGLGHEQRWFSERGQIQLRPGQIEHVQDDLVFRGLKYAFVGALLQQHHFFVADARLLVQTHAEHSHDVSVEIVST